MRIQRDKRLHTERTKTIKSRYQQIEKIVTAYQRTHHPREFFVSTPDICESPGISESVVGPSDKTFQECLAGIPDLIPETHARALEKRQGELLKLLPEGSTDDNLALAVSWFKCRYCGQSFHHAAAIMHSCHMFRMWSYKTYEEIKIMAPLEQVYHLCGRGTWLTDRLTHWKDAAELTKQVIEAAGMDANKVTSNELDDANLRFVVFTGPGSSTMTIVGWRCLVSSHQSVLFFKVTQRENLSCEGHRQVQWGFYQTCSRVEDHETGRNARVQHPSVRLEKEDWACLHCWTGNAVPYTDKTWALLKVHLKEKCVQRIPSTLLWISASNIWSV
jgi:hypothetical protein